MFFTIVLLLFKTPCPRSFAVQDRLLESYLHHAICIASGVIMEYFALSSAAFCSSGLRACIPLTQSS